MHWYSQTVPLRTQQPILEPTRLEQFELELSLTTLESNLPCIAQTVTSRSQLLLDACASPFLSPFSNTIRLDCSDSTYSITQQLAFPHMNCSELLCQPLVIPGPASSLNNSSTISPSQSLPFGRNRRGLTRLDACKERCCDGI